MADIDRQEPSDTALVRAARANPDAFCALYDRNVKPLLAWLLSQAGDVEVAMDLVAETFAIALRSLTSFRGERPASGRAWLYGIALRLLLRHRETALRERRARDRLRMRREPYLDVTDGIDERLLVEELRPELERALAELPQRQREALDLRIVDELDYDEVAARLKTTPVAARLRVSRALKTLREALQGDAT